MDDLTKQLSELLEKDTWTPEESKWMLAYLDSPNSSELELLMGEQFNEFNPDLIPEKLSVQMLGELHERLGITEEGSKAPVMRMWIRRIAIAASVLLVVGLGWKYFSTRKEQAPIARQEQKKAAGPQLVWRHEVNTSGSEKSIQLPDSSLIVLANQSEISYQEPFINSRDIKLTGKAWFKVKHDPRPFIVTSGDLTTTDLGTQFTVTAMKNTHRIIVRLYEGKVVIRPVDRSNKLMKKDVYLAPGQEFVYWSERWAKVKTFKVTNAAPETIMEAERTTDNPLLPKNVEAPWFMFNNQPLENVLNDLAALYGVSISYNKKDIQNIYFTGRYNKTESLENILKRISTLNNLTITRKDSAYIISK